MINSPPRFKGRNIRIPIIIPIKGRKGGGLRVWVSNEKSHGKCEVKAGTDRQSDVDGDSKLGPHCESWF